MKARPSHRRHVAGPWLAAGAALLAFMPSLSSAWLNWDDGFLAANNPYIRGLGWAGLRWAFTASPGGAYQPLAFVSYALDYALWGAAARGFHLTNALLHAAAAALVFFCARRMMLLAGPLAEDEPQAALDASALLAAFVFALHPLRVESVSWIAERRDPLCGVFWLGAVLAYMHAREPGRAGSLIPCVALYAAACLAKGTAVTLPLVLLILDAWPLRRPLRSSIREKASMLLTGAALGALALARQSEARASWKWADHGLASRLAQAAYALVFYVRKTAWPSGLAALYEARPPLDPLEPRFLMSGLLVFLAAALLWRERKRRPALAAAAAAYAMVLLPVSGLLQAGSQLVADRYSYLATIPFAMLAGAALRACLRRPRARPFALAAAAGLSAALAAASVRQQAFWRDSESLWRRVLAVDPASPIAMLNLGEPLAESGRVAQAADLFSRALASDPACARAQGDPVALESKPVCRNALNDLGAARAQLGDLSEARRLLLQAVSADPGDASARRNLAHVEALLEKRGHFARLDRHGESSVQEGRGR